MPHFLWALPNLIFFFFMKHCTRLNFFGKTKGRFIYRTCSLELHGFGDFWRNLKLDVCSALKNTIFQKLKKVGWCGLMHLMQHKKLYFSYETFKFYRSGFLIISCKFVRVNVVLLLFTIIEFNITILNCSPVVYYQLYLLIYECCKLPIKDN